MTAAAGVPPKAERQSPPNSGFNRLDMDEMESVSDNVRRYECRWRAEGGKQVHYWVDHSPSEPHWPDSAVMRWDLRQKDWDKIWPELIDHPCAILFAPRHPHRVGPRVFRDWVQSWPIGYDWERSLPKHLHAAIRDAYAEISTPVPQPGPQVSPGPEVVSSVVPLGLCGELVERLAVVLLDLNDAKRFEAAQLLSALALAPDSAKAVEALGVLLAPGQKRS